MVGSLLEGSLGLGETIGAAVVGAAVKGGAVVGGAVVGGAVVGGTVVVGAAVVGGVVVVGGGASWSRMKRCTVKRRSPSQTTPTPMWVNWGSTMFA